MGFDTKKIIDNFKDNVTLDVLGATNRNIKAIDPQKTYMWDIDILNTGVIPYIGNLMDNIKVYAKAITIPNEGIEPIQLSMMGERLFYAGKENSTHSFQITFWDDEQGTIRRYLDTWYQTCHGRKTGNAVHKKNYQREIRIKTKDSTDALVTSIVTLTGCFPVDIAEIALSYDNSDIMEVSATFQYDNKKLTT